MPRAYSYVRFSTPQQALGDSLRRQYERTEAYCLQHGLTLDDAQRMRDLGLSGYHGQNKAFNRLLKNDFRRRIGTD